MPHPSQYLLILSFYLFLSLTGCAQQVTQPVQPPAPPQLDLRQHIESSMADHSLRAFGVELKAEAVLQAFYLERNFQLAWFDGQLQPTPQAMAMVKEITQIGRDGLSPQDYHERRLRNLSDAKHKEVLDFDLLLSDAAANLSRHLLMGKVDPESISPEWQAMPRQRDWVQVMKELAAADSLAERLKQLRPRQVRYTRLQKLLEKLDPSKAPAWSPLALRPSIKPGALDDRVQTVRERLSFWGDLEPDAPAPAGSVYDAPLQAAMRRFQARHGLDADGVIGPKTFDALNVTPAERRRQVVINMERWRWLAEDLGEKHVLVNIAGFELKVVEHNTTIMQKPVIVGRHYRRTPVFSDRIRYLVFNPTWTVPHKLAAQDKLPEIQADPAYLQRLGFTVFDREQNPVDPTQVDWSRITERNFPYRLVQAPGPQNALGQVKFMFPNPHDVYLHDTPARELFRQSDRAFSSGCVRVAEPLDLAALLLKDQGMTRAQIEAVLGKGELTTIFLKNPVPVHIEYWTAWIDSRDQLNFRADIYERDPPLAAALAAPLYAE